VLGDTSVLVSRYLTETDTWTTLTQLSDTRPVESIFGVSASIRGGHAVVGWMQDDSNNVTSSYIVARWNGSGWGAPETVGASDATIADAPGGPPAIAIDAQGNVTALWSQSVGNVRNIYINYYGPVAPSL
jgi:hypothetical protein